MYFVPINCFAYDTTLSPEFELVLLVSVCVVSCFFASFSLLAAVILDSSAPLDVSCFVVDNKGVNLYYYKPVLPTICQIDNVDSEKRVRDFYAMLN